MANLSGFAADLARHIGQTVTIFTTSGGDSGSGFTGVLVSVNCNFVRLITQLGSAPGCALGNCCDERRENTDNVNRGCTEEENNQGGLGNDIDFIGGTGNRQRRGTNRENTDRQRRIDCRGNTLGAVIDIPIDRIASFVHNAVGSGW
jgi:hypothetical protein